MKELQSLLEGKFPELANRAAEVGIGVLTNRYEELKKLERETEVIGKDAVAAHEDSQTTPDRQQPGEVVDN